ncbi:type II toxin-antitoxin system RatA family toxin [Alphaproteobacteria bacterium]|nr:type II toxin-antitoxin system RatA family toxin [Alphaproteobacteria bacterium]
MTIHAEKRVLPHSPEQLYALVADVKSYPQFLPWCLAARIRSQSDTELQADLIIGFKMFREKFTSHVELDAEAGEINVRYAEGPFKYLRNKWLFVPHPDGCEIDFYVDFEFNSRLLQSVIETLFTEAVRRMVGAFEARADDLYGAPAAPAIKSSN